MDHKVVDRLPYLLLMAQNSLINNKSGKDGLSTRNRPSSLNSLWAHVTPPPPLEQGLSIYTL